jgi:hypothetical protein
MQTSPLVIALAACGLVLASGAQALPIHGRGTWETTLLARDLNGDGSVDAFYDTALNMTWLRDANAIGRADWDTASAWADKLMLGGHGDWRLPIVCTQWSCSWSSEMSHLSEVTLGNPWGAGGSEDNFNTADFQGLQFDDYWSGSVFHFRWHDEPWVFDFSDSVGYFTGKQERFYAMAVHPGDAGAPVPEPASRALVLLGLSALVANSIIRSRAGRGRAAACVQAAPEFAAFARSGVG